MEAEAFDNKAAQAEYKKRLAEAVQWLQEEGHGEKPVTAARIYDVDADSIRIALKRAKVPKKRCGGNNKILSDTQTKAIEAYCYEQWELGMGATKKMVYAAICFLLSEQGKKTPSWRWFQVWLKGVPTLYTIKTKPIARNRVETHTERDLEEWFEKYRYNLDKYKIRSARNIHNMDESGVRIGCPKGEEVVVPILVKELYTPSPENRKSVTIMECISADGREPTPPLIICPGMRIMESWIHDNLKGSEVIALSTTGYTNAEIAICWLKHFIKHVGAGPDKAWKMLLLDGHVTHENPDFVILAHENHIKPFEYPSHLTHVLQPLDVGVFRPWKHYHNKAIQHALRSLDFEYTITSFFRDLNGIREQTFKEFTMKNAFRDSGMWPVSFKAAKKKMRQYSGKKKSENDDNDNATNANENPILPQLPGTYDECERALNEFVDRVPQEFSSPSKERYTKTLEATQIHLIRASLQQEDHRNMQNRLYEQQRARASNRRSLNSGGPLDVEQARQKKSVKAKKERNEAIRKAEKAVNNAIKKAQRALNRRGIDARRAERQRKKRVAEMKARGEAIPIEMNEVIRDPEKTPTEEDLESLKPHPSLVEALKALQGDTPIDPQFLEENEEGHGEVELRVECMEESFVALSEESEQEEDIPSDNDSIASLDSIARNADFVSLGF